MKNTIRVLLAILLVMATILCFASCNGASKPTETTAPEETIAAEGLWKSATHRKNVTVGEGSKSVIVDVEIDGKSIAITVNTDKATLGEALFAEKLINDASFFDTLNGIKADWEADQAYWGFYKGEEYMSVGVGEVNISGGERYRFVYAKYTNG